MEPAAADSVPRPDFNSQALHVTVAIKTSEMERRAISVNTDNSLGSARLHIEIETGEVGPVDLDVSVFVVVCRAEQPNLLFFF